MHRARRVSPLLVLPLLLALAALAPASAANDPPATGPSPNESAPTSPTAPKPSEPAAPLPEPGPPASPAPDTLPRAVEPGAPSEDTLAYDDPYAPEPVPVYQRWWFWVGVAAVTAGAVAAFALSRESPSRPACPEQAMGYCR